MDSTSIDQIYRYLSGCGATSVETHGRPGGKGCRAGKVADRAACTDITRRRRGFSHLNNTTPAQQEDSPERAMVQAAGRDVAEHGM